MRSTSLVVAALAAYFILPASRADACGGCFHPPPGPMEHSQVTGHRMALSISKEYTTLWDQIKYDGDPKEFAWVLPVKGTVDVQLSSDLMFDLLDTMTDRDVSLEQCPVVNCATEVSSSSDSSSAASSSSGGVTVTAERVVGPYETVVLKATDPKALETWLAQHGYVVPPDVQPVVDAYVGESFDFLAMKLLPTFGVDKMRPVRVTTPGASPVLPLRMVAAGTGPTTAITLWVIGEGRYEPKNLPWFRIDPDKLRFDRNSLRSNYDDLEQLGFLSSANLGFNIIAGEPLNAELVAAKLTSSTEKDPAASGYGDASDGFAHATEEAFADTGALFYHIPSASTAVTRLHAVLSRAALKEDLILGASADQTNLQRRYVIPLSHQLPVIECTRCRRGLGCAISGSDGGDPPLWMLAAASLGLVARRLRRRASAD